MIIDFMILYNVQLFSANMAELKLTIFVRNIYCYFSKRKRNDEKIMVAYKMYYIGFNCKKL